jgi:hypothetical protein
MQNPPPTQWVTGTCALDVILGGVSVRLGTWLRLRPAATSERTALFGVDPFHLANLSMQDAKRVIALHPRGVRGYKQLVGEHPLHAQPMMLSNPV